MRHHPVRMAPTGAAAHAPLTLTAFVALLAALMALNALATDIMLPALPAMVPDLGATGTTEMQTVISAYLLGFGLGQILIGVVSDRYGRKPLLVGGLGVYLAASVAIALAPDLETVLIARFVQGMGAASPRVIATATVRDCYEGRRMARVMSLVMMVFMAAPVIAPGMGQLILLVAPWQAIFWGLAGYAAVMLALCAALFPETLTPERRRPIRLDTLHAALHSILGNRQTVGYTLAAGAYFGALFGYINSSQQLIVGVYGLGDWFGAVFGLTAFTLGVSAFLNSRLVERHGMRLLSHAAVCIFFALSLAMAGLQAAGLLGAAVFVPLITLMMMLVGLVFANFNALAMAPQGHVAGMAAALTGAGGILVGTGVGYLIGQAFDGTPGPLAIGFVLASAATILVLLATERGRLFRPGGAQG